MKRCPDCGQVKPIEDFVRNSSTKSGRGFYCRPCWNIRIKRHKQKLYGGERAFLLQLRYKLTQEELERMLDAQEGLCAICRMQPAKHVDHCHATGVVRGLLVLGAIGGWARHRTTRS